MRDYELLLSRALRDVKLNLSETKLIILPPSPYLAPHLMSPSQHMTPPPTQLRKVEIWASSQTSSLLVLKGLPPPSISKSCQFSPPNAICMLASSLSPKPGPRLSLLSKLPRSTWHQQDCLGNPRPLRTGLKLIDVYVSFWAKFSGFTLSRACLRGFQLESDSVCQEMGGEVWRYLWLSQLKGCYWCLVGGSQGCRSTPYNAQGAPKTKSDLFPNINRTEGENPLELQTHAGPDPLITHPDESMKKLISV